MSDPAGEEPAMPGAAPGPPRASPAGDDETRERIIEALRTCFDPEIPVNIYDLGLIYEVRFDPERRHAYVRMTLTSPACPVAGSLPGEVEQKVASVDGVDGVAVDLVWDPPWTMAMLSEAARLQLGGSAGAVAAQYTGQAGRRRQSGVGRRRADRVGGWESRRRS